MKQQLNCHKESFATRSDAMKKKKRQFKTYGTRFSVYHCGCGAYHLTTQKRASKHKRLAEGEVTE